jgi:para-aminobenzoate synthetase component 1
VTGASARFGARGGGRLLELTDDPARLDQGGFWAVAAGFEGRFVAARFERADPEIHASAAVLSWPGVHRDSWTSSLDEAAYTEAVEKTRQAISVGDVYQANVCRILSAPVEVDDLRGLADVLARHHPAPYQGHLCLPEAGVQIATASPELFLRRRGRQVWSAPIKGTGRVAADLGDKDAAENVMIVDLVRNDLGRVCETGSVEVESLLRVEEHPGLVHLVSTVTGTLRVDAGWGDLLEATFPPGSVTGAPKSSALQLIRNLEPVPRGWYCGAIGWVDADTQEAELAVAIRTFALTDGVLSFGTGAGITWASDPQAEWAETELKAERLIGLASREHA